MWDPYTDLLSGRALSLYEYNLAYDIPLYLHINSAHDSPAMLAFWWYASCCRHLGIGGLAAGDEQWPRLGAAMGRCPGVTPRFVSGRGPGLRPRLVSTARVPPCPVRGDRPGHAPARPRRRAGWGRRGGADRVQPDRPAGAASGPPGTGWPEPGGG